MAEMPAGGGPLVVIGVAVEPGASAGAGGGVVGLPLPVLVPEVVPEPVVPADVVLFAVGDGLPVVGVVVLVPVRLKVPLVVPLPVVGVVVPVPVRV